MGTKSEIMVKQYYIHTVVRYKINNKSLTSPLKGFSSLGTHHVWESMKVGSRVGKSLYVYVVHYFSLTRRPTVVLYKLF